MFPINRLRKNVICIASLMAIAPTLVLAGGGFDAKPSPDEVITILKEGNTRFYTGEATYPHVDQVRLALAGTENQGDHAMATVIACSDSRVPVELVFDAGVMDIFTVRVAGNVLDGDEIGSVEYGLAHVNTPVFVVLGHTQCGAVTAVTHAVTGNGHALERNIPALVDNIIPAVEEVIHEHDGLSVEEIIPLGIKQNIWQGIEDLFTKSPATRRLVNEGKVKVVGAIYDVATGKINWLPEEEVSNILTEVEASGKMETEEFASSEGDDNSH